jgi:hypothetical protein
VLSADQRLDVGQNIGFPEFLFFRMHSNITTRYAIKICFAILISVHKIAIRLRWGGANCKPKNKQEIGTGAVMQVCRKWWSGAVFLEKNLNEEHRAGDSTT